ncbi:MAG: hypothetical protein J0H44_17210 [Alphaproteobacteria bacterium]|nr:hypothetical protein [Alphaproteobacteria bacterium]
MASSPRCTGINPITCDIRSKPPGTIEWERFVPVPA